MEIITKVSGKKFSFDSRLNEYDPGVMNESFEHFKQRIMGFFKEVESKGYQTVLICTHGSIISALVNLITKGDLSEQDIYKYPLPGILLELRNGLIKEYDFN